MALKNYFTNIGKALNFSEKYYIINYVNANKPKKNIRRLTYGRDR